MGRVTQLVKDEFFKIAAGYILGATAVIYCLYVAATGTQPILQVLLCILGAALGWIAGILITPLNSKERKRFSEYAKAVAAFLSGYVIAKFDVVAQASVIEMAKSNSELFFTRSLVFSICFSVSMLFTFIGRSYIHGTDAEMRTKRDKAIREIDEALQTLNRYNA